MRKSILFVLFSFFALVANADKANIHYPRKIVMEEATGTWCGWCVRGIETIERMSQEYPDNFIGIGLHSGDAMANPVNYGPIASKFSAYPNCIFNRNSNGAVSVDYYSAKRVVEQYKDDAIAKISSKAVFANSEKSQVKVSTESTFGFSENGASYRIAYVVLEDRVGPYMQNNAYAGNSSYDNPNNYMYNWVLKSSPTEVLFNDVARGIFGSADGVDGSVPKSLTEGVVYSYDYVFTLPTNITNKDNIRMVVLLLDGNTGEILNADQSSVTTDENVNATAFSYYYGGAKLADGSTITINAKEDDFGTGEMTCDTNPANDPKNGLILSTKNGSYQTGKATIEITKNTLAPNRIQWCMGGECVLMTDKTYLEKDFQTDNTGVALVQFDATGIQNSGTLVARLTAKIGNETHVVNINFVLHNKKRTIHVATAGTLPDLISDAEKYTIEELTLTGVLNGSDIRIIRELAGCDFVGNKTGGSLKLLDLSEARIVEGGEKYLDTDNISAASIGGGFRYNTETDVITKHMFSGCSSLISLILPNNITTIETNGVAYCRNLTTLNIPQSVTTINAWGFCECSSLKSVTIPASVTYIGNRAFCNCSALEEIIVKEGNTNYISVNGVLFNKNMTQLIRYPVGNSATSYSIPITVKTINELAFDNAKNLTSIEMPEGLERIDNIAFYRCNALAFVKFPNSLRIIGEISFGSCSELTTVDIPDGVTSIGASGFSGCSKLTSISIPKSVTFIGSTPFSGCNELQEINVSTNNEKFQSLSGVLFDKSLTTVINYPIGKKETEYSIPTSVTTVERGAFNGAKNLTSIIIPNGVICINNDCFRNCTGIESITIPESVKSIGDYAFYMCDKLTSVTSNIAEPFAIPSNTFSFYRDNLTLTVPYGKKAVYESTNGWKNFKTIIEDNSQVAQETIAEVVDLGLSVKWASWNVGADKPEGLGNLYAWGELSPKTDYSTSTYKFYSGGYTKYGSVDGKYQLDSEDDVAQQKWGDKWRMPTFEELKELKEKCTFTKTELNGVPVTKVTGPNGNCIYFPYPGNFTGTYLYYKNSIGSYWSCDLETDSYAKDLDFISGLPSLNGDSRYHGQSIRPVYVGGANSEISIETKIFDANSQPMLVGGFVENYSEQNVSKKGIIVSKSADDMIITDETVFDNATIFLQGKESGRINNPYDIRFIDCTGTNEEQFACALQFLMGNTDYYVKAFVIDKENNVFYGSTEKVHTQDFNRYDGWADYANVYYYTSHTLFDLVTDEIIDKAKGYYSTTNESPTTVMYRTGGGAVYKLATEWNYKLWYSQCFGWDGSPLKEGKSVHFPTMKFADGLLTIEKNPLDADKDITIYYSINGNYFRPETYTDVYTAPISISKPCAVYCYAISPEGYISYTNIYVIGDYTIENGNDNNSEFGAVADIVDLGLSVKWASWNVGASKIADYGGLYGAGDPTGLNISTDASDYYFRDGESICGTEYDLAHVKWGDNWRMPTFEELKELKEKCTWEANVLYEGVLGCVATGPNGNSIFIPYAGSRHANEVLERDYRASIYSGNMGSPSYTSGYMDLDILVDGRFQMDGCRNWVGQSIRPVYVGNINIGSNDNNQLVVDNVSTCKGKTATLSIGLSNETTDLSAYQFDLTLPPGITLAKDNNDNYLITKTSRYEDDEQVLQITLLEDNTYRIVCYSNESKKIAGTSGALLNIILNVTSTHTAGIFEANIDNIVFTKANGSQIKLNSAKFNIEVHKAMIGDANGDVEINVADVVEIVKDILHKTTSKFVREAADVNEDGEINITDIVLVVNMIMGGNANSARGLSQDSFNDVLSLYENGNHSFSLALENRGGYVASQFDLILSKRQTLEGIFLNGNRSNGHMLAYTKTGDNQYKVVVYSLDNQPYNLNEGELLSIKTSGNGNIEINNILFVTETKAEKRFSPLHSGTLGIDMIESAQPVDIYSVDGRLVRSQAESTNGLTKGIYIINGKKHVVR